jgi:uncharacterized membrane protein
MGFVEIFKKKFDIGIDILQIISYTISFFLISFSIIRSIYTYIVEYIDSNIDDLTVFKETRLDLAKSITLSLSFLLGVEVLKLFHIQTYRQLVIVVSLVFIKLLISYFLLREIELSQEE